MLLHHGAAVGAERCLCGSPINFIYCSFIISLSLILRAAPNCLKFIAQAITPLIVDSPGIVQGSFYLLPSERKAWYNLIINKNDKEAIVS